MKPLTFEEIVDALEGMCDRAVPPGSVARVTTDSRQVEPGDLFVAIRGERFDGHDFVGEALARGALAAVVRSDFELPKPLVKRGQAGEGPRDALMIRVDDPVAGLGRLAHFYRRSVMGRAVSVIAVTGSNGKTTTKGMIAHVLQGRWPGRASVKSFNNQIGVPLTLLSVEPADTFVVCEAGTNAPGEIAGLARLIEPDLGVITGVSEAHLEGLGTLEKVAVEKLSLLHHLRPDGCAVINADCELLRERFKWDRDLSRLKCVTFGEWPEADLRLTDVQAIAPPEGVEASDDSSSPSSGGIAFTVNNRFTYRLGVPGRHNAMNALAAISVARRFSMDHEEIAERLASFELPPMRLSFERLGRVTIINDAYNANPASLAAAVEVLVNTPSGGGRRVLIVGHMRELGAASEALHQRVAEQIGRAGIDLVVAIGDHAKLVAGTVEAASEGLTETHAYASTLLAKRRFASYLKNGDTILLKGSRLLGLETLVPAIREWAAGLGRSGAAKKAAGSPSRLTA